MPILQGLVASNGKLFAAWKGEPGDDRIFYSSWNGSGAWETAKTIGGNTSVGPSLGILNKSLYAAWKGEWSDPSVFYATYNGSKWEAQKAIANVYSDTGPALCGHGDKLYAAWKSVFDKSLYYATFDGTKWSGETQMSDFRSTGGPSLATSNGKLYATWKGESSNDLWYASFDGSSWSGQKQLSAGKTNVGPSLAEVNGKLYAVWKGENDTSMWYATFDGTSWSGQTQLPKLFSDIGPAIAEFNGKLYAMYKGQNGDVSLHNANYDGTSWSGQSNDIPGNTGQDDDGALLAPASGGNTNYAFADSNGASLTGASVTILVAEDIVPDSQGDYSFQINCNSSQQAAGSAPFVWQQYFFVVTDNEICARVNCFRQQDLPASPYLNWDSRPPRMPQGQGTLPLSNNRLPKGSQLTMTLATNARGAVDGFAFSIALPGGASLSTPVITLQSIGSQVVPNNLAPIIKYQTILVAKLGGLTQNFSAGKGLFLFAETNSLVATAAVDESGENSNVPYGSLPASYPNGEFYQTFGIGLS